MVTYRDSGGSAPAVSFGKEAMSLSSRGTPNLLWAIGVALTLMLAFPAFANAQERGNPDGEWRYQSADAWGGLVER